MEYRPSLPDKNHNVSHEHPLREFLVLGGWLVAVIIAAYWIMGLFVNLAVESISPQMELRILEATGADKIDSFATDDEIDSELVMQLDTLLLELSQCADIGYPANLAVDGSDAVNAFAVPGGKIVVMQGLLDAVSSENGLAFVLAHELAHFKNRDHLRSMGRGVVLLALAILATGPNSELSTFLSPVSSLQSAQFSQSRESAADATALTVLNCHYTHVGGATELFESLDGKGQDFNFGLSHYFSSHPEARRRIKALQELRAANGYSLGHTEALFDES
jgi:Zn-dependent protease with chaperone function